MRNLIPVKFISLFCLFISLNAFSQEHIISVDVTKPVATVQPTMWGIFFEDINFAADGGIYAELVKNRSFEFLKPLMGWKIMKPDTTTGMLILNQSETNPLNPRYARISIAPGEPSFGLSNEGFRGVGIRQGITYQFSVLARQKGKSKLKMRIELVNPQGAVISSSSLLPDSESWKRCQVSFEATATEKKAKLNIWFEGEGGS